MKTGADHLPARKRLELEFVIEILRAAADAAPEGRLLKVILFGSYSRGGWVDDPIGHYKSDFDLLLVVDTDAMADFPEVWRGADDRFLDELLSGRRLRTPVGLIAHTLTEVNEMLARGRSFFVDVLRDGIVLHEEPGYPFVAPEPLTPAVALEEARDYYQAWFDSAEAFRRGATFFRQAGAPKEAVFALHQAAESYYDGLILVLSLYSPKSHNLNFLRGQAEALEPSLAEVWPRKTSFERRCFERLRDAYVKARYSRRYSISDEELDWLAGRIGELEARARPACEARLATLEAAVRNASG